jgi:hypothetical protein
MTVGTIRSQGTELFVADTVRHSTATIVKMLCPTGVQGLGGPRSQINDTCLDAKDEETFTAGLATPGQVTVPFNFIPSGQGHQFLFDWKEAGTKMRWMIGFSDGVAIPTLNGNGQFVPPASPQRTTAEFTAFVADVNLDIATNDIVKGTLLLQRSGAVQWHWNGPTPTV